MSVGKIYILLNTTIYIICLLVFNIQIAIYSLVYAFLYGKGLDYFHEHNLEASVMIFTRNPEVKDRIIVDIHRGVPSPLRRNHSSLLLCAARSARAAAQ